MPQETPHSVTRHAIDILGGLASAAILFAILKANGNTQAVSGMAATVVLMAIWWIRQAIPMAATALIPLIAYPIFGISNAATTSKSYMSPVIMLFLGGFLIAIGMQRSGLHRRIALHIIARLGSSPAGLTLGFMLASAFLSMWISNTATAMMMVSIGLAVVSQASKNAGKGADALSMAIMLSIAYGCSAGGVASLIGTPTNLVFVATLAKTFPEAEPIAFGQWMLLGVPLALGVIAILWSLLTFVFISSIRNMRFDRNSVQEELAQQAPFSRAEKTVASIFTATCLLWIFRKPIEVGFLSLPGWSEFWGPLEHLDDSSVAILMALLLFLIPAGAERKPLLDGKAFTEIPWSILLLFAGGFALAGGFAASGLSETLSQNFGFLSNFSPLLMIAILCLSISFLTEFTSNTATASMILPVLAALAPSLGMDSLALMLPATIAASMAFMMPVATPPNAIVMASGKVPLPSMARFGFWANLATGIWVVLISRLLIPLVF